MWQVILKSLMPLSILLRVAKALISAYLPPKDLCSGGMLSSQSLLQGLGALEALDEAALRVFKDRAR